MFFDENVVFCVCVPEDWAKNYNVLSQCQTAQL